jgi:hypothetical protein
MTLSGRRVVHLDVRQYHFWSGTEPPCIEHGLSPDLSHHLTGNEERSNSKEHRIEHFVACQPQNNPVASNIGHLAARTDWPE